MHALKQQEAILDRVCDQFIIVLLPAAPVTSSFTCPPVRQAILTKPAEDSSRDDPGPPGVFCFNAGKEQVWRLG